MVTNVVDPYACISFEESDLVDGWARKHGWRLVAYDPGFRLGLGDGRTWDVPRDVMAKLLKVCP